jgi:hypothetical protein
MLIFVPLEKTPMPITDRLIGARDRIPDLQGALAFVRYCRTNSFFKEKLDDILAATRQAGREIVEKMEVTPATLDRIRQPLVESTLFAQMGNLFWKSCIAEGVTPNTFKDRNMVPRPDSLESFMLLFQLGLNSEAAGDKQVVLQFDFSGEVNESCYFTIETGKVEARRGVAETAVLVIQTPFDLWMDIITRKADGQKC